VLDTLFEDDAPTSKDEAEPSAKQQLEGTVGKIDKLVLMMLAMKAMQPPIPPSPPQSPMAVPPSTSPLPMGAGQMPMGPMSPPSAMGGSMMPQTQLQDALTASRGLV